MLATLDDRDCAYVYDRGVVTKQARALLAMSSVARVFYAIKANPHPAILRTIAAAGLGFECVSCVNLTRLDEPPTERCTVVGPICESGDVLGSDRMLPPCQEGDVVLIGDTGAYGHAMGSHYNLRPPAAQLLMPD